MDIIIRHCGAVGWLGIVEMNGSEIYRTGKHCMFPHEALVKCTAWLATKE